MRNLASLFVLAAVVLSAGAVHAKSPVQITPDEVQILVNKPVGTEQWVLALDLDNLTLTGNVFDTQKPPTFFSCDVEFSPDDWVDIADIAAETLTLDCQVASGCSALPCDAATEWHPLGTTPSIGGSFFLP